MDFRHVTRKHSDGNQGAQEIHISNKLSLSRIRRGIDRVKEETKVICHLWDRHTFIGNVFGPKETWLVPGYEAAEWGFILYLFKTKSVSRIIRISITTLGSVLVPPLGLVLYTRFIVSLRASEKLRYIGSKYAQRNIDADEEWWFINGTGVNSDLQAANGYHISEIFQKQVRLFYNPTTGLLFDFAQCAVGLISYKTRPSTQLAKSLIKAFESSPTLKVKLLVHSMGAIITANAMKYMIRKGWTKDLYRLEVYTFGSPTLEFLSVVDKSSMRRVPFYEHYVNTSDFFGSLGALRMVNGNWWAVGRVFTREKRGHFFGEHYLVGLSQHAYTWRGSTQHSRLYSYMPPYPTPVPASFNPYSLPEYLVNPRRPRRNTHSHASASHPSHAPSPAHAPSPTHAPPSHDLPAHAPPSHEPSSAHAASSHASPSPALSRAPPSHAVTSLAPPSHVPPPAHALSSHASPSPAPSFLASSPASSSSSTSSTSLFPTPLSPKSTHTSAISSTHKLPLSPPIPLSPSLSPPLSPSMSKPDTFLFPTVPLSEPSFAPPSLTSPSVSDTFLFPTPLPESSFAPPSPSNPQFAKVKADTFALPASDFYQLLSELGNGRQ